MRKVRLDSIKSLSEARISKVRQAIESTLSQDRQGQLVSEVQIGLRKVRFGSV